MNLIERPWRQLDEAKLPEIALQAPGWLLPIERKLLWWLGAHYWKGDGAIVDAGAFCGASAVAFASGVRASANLEDALRVNRAVRQAMSGSRHGPIVSFDKFVDVDGFEKDFIEEAFGARIEKGDAFLDYYLQAVRPYLDLIRVEAGDFLEKQWNGQPIEVLFLDICKTRALNAHALTQFLPHLIPGHGVLIQQDFMGVWLPHLNWSMEYLKDYFDILDTDCGPSRVYRLKKAIPEALIADIAGGRVSLDARLKLLEDLRVESLANTDPGTAMLAEGMTLQELVLEGELKSHDDMWRRFLERHSIPADATGDDFTGETWAIDRVPNWIPRQVMTMRETRLRFWGPAL